MRYEGIKGRVAIVIDAKSRHRRRDPSDHARLITANVVHLR